MAWWRRFRAPLLALLLAPGAAAASWEPGATHLTLQYAGLDYALGATSESARPSATVVRVGHQLSERFGVQGRLGLRGGGGDAAGAVDGGAEETLTVRLDRLAGLYASARIGRRDRVSGYALAGYTDARAGAAGVQATASEAARGPSVGVGLDYAFDPDYRVNLEYMHYIDRGEVRLSALGIGFSIRL